MPLRQMAEQRGWSVQRVYSDRMSGTKADRPGLKALMADARRGEFEIVLVWRFDRFARSVKQLVLALEEFRTVGVQFISHQEALDTSSPMGEAMFAIIAAMAQLERRITLERVVAGLDYARSHGTKSGRGLGRPRVAVDAEAVQQMRDVEGLGWRQIAARLRFGVGTVRRDYERKPISREACQKPCAAMAA